MPPRDNNSRITPDAVIDNKIQPVSAPVNKLQTFRPDLSEYESSKANIEALAKLGQGISASLPLIDKGLRNKADEVVFSAYKKTEEKNRNDWAAVSANIPGMAKYNPYNQDVYRKIQGNSVVRNAIAEFGKIKELEKKSPEEFEALLETNLQNIFTQFNELGLKERDYHDYLVDYDNKVNNLRQAYLDKNTEYQYELYKNKVAADGGYKYYQVTLENPQNKVGALVSVADGLVNDMNLTGTPSDTQAAVLMNAVTNAISIDPSKFTSADLVLAFSNYKINGVAIEELIPGFSGKLQTMIRQAKTAHLNDQKLEYETKEFNQMLNREAAEDELIELFKSGTTLSPQESVQWGLEMIEKYGLDGPNSIKLFNDIAAGRKSFIDLKNIPSDPEVLVDLTAGVVSGTVTKTDIANAIGEGHLSADDGLKLFDRLNTIEQKQKQVKDKRVDEHIKVATKEFIKGDGKNLPPKLNDKDNKQAFQESILSLQERYDKGEITYEEFNNGLYLEKQLAKEYEARSRTKKIVGDYASLANTLYSSPNLTDSYYRQVNTNKDLASFKRMGLIRENNKPTANFYLTSYPKKIRTINGKTRKHTGYDFGGSLISAGKPVYAPIDQNATVIGRYYDKKDGNGNVLMLRTDDGLIYKYIHLQKSNMLPPGTKIRAGANIPVAYIGKSGFTEKNIIGAFHVEIFDEKGNPQIPHRIKRYK